VEVTNTDGMRQSGRRKYRVGRITRRQVSRLQASTFTRNTFRDIGLNAGSSQTTTRSPDCRLNSAQDWNAL